ncbi:5'/3'-nucleotidase SurE [Ahniella affigens]|uniref:5'-nucleotidase SurE n=1 Tax=Ahniella affigens TaxID=2021234 RepID=A0A2P1PYV7_9GAMM|nr:5'/3'-nucleotidase SurE [Ahniella affigens]AVQ00028.1 5'/3'-nucleotidase SurE [Ahniella affigens]
MHVLVANDDGVDAPGIRHLADAMRQIGRVTVVAPDRNRSGASNSLTLDQPIRVQEIEPNRFRVNGTPTDCVHLALLGMLDKDPDIVVSGINDSSNLGDDVIYSGTVAAAIEGRYLGHPAVAVSLVSKDHQPEHFETAARAAVLIVRQLLKDPLPADTILNVNVPDRPFAELAGFQVTRLGNRHRAEPCVRQQDPRGRDIWWVGPAGPEQDAGPGTDFHAVRHGFVSITPLQVDLTRYSALDKLSRWIAPLSQSLPGGGS